MENPSESASSSPLRRSSRSEKKPQLRSSTKKAQWPETPEKPPGRVRNRGVALSIADIRKVAEGLQDRKQRTDTTPSQAKTARRQIVLPSPRKPKSVADGSYKLPEKCEILCKFFDSLDSSIRLLRLKGSMASFTNISRKVESLTDRRFTHSHLAQLKFILPEALVIKKELVLDERTRCMKPDLHVTIDPDAVEYDAKLPPQSGTTSLRKLFRERLRDFCKSHPEGDEIPEEALPEPFNHPKKDQLLDNLKTPSSFPTRTSSASMQNSDIADNTDPAPVPVMTSIEALNQQPVVASHMSQTFRKRFSMKSKADSVQQQSPSDLFQVLPLSISDSNLKKNPPFEGTESHPKILPAELDSEAASCEKCPEVHVTSSSAQPATPRKTIEYTENKDGFLKSIDVMSTPAKSVSTPLRLMTATPALPPPKRNYMSPDDNSTSSPNKLVRRPPRSRSLKFDTPVKSEDGAGGLSIDDDVFDILQEDLIQSIREKERIAMEERDPAISQAKRRQKAIASLPKLFKMIAMLFHDIKRSIMTKEELISKIISSHCDIVDRSEVEEQLKLLLELLPEWISEKLALSGDKLVRINKMLNEDTLLASLEVAK